MPEAMTPKGPRTREEWLMAGCIPAGLQDIDKHDLDEPSLPGC